MELLVETIILGLDLIVLEISRKEYLNWENIYQKLKNAPTRAIDAELEKSVKMQPENRIEMAVISGIVSPIGMPLSSSGNPPIPSVITINTIFRHCVNNGLIGMLRSEMRNRIHESFNQMPFELRDKGYAVNIHNAINANILKLELVQQQYKPIKLTCLERFLNIFESTHTVGYIATEQVLSVGRTITAAGELTFEAGMLHLQATNASPLFITTGDKSSLLPEVEHIKYLKLLKTIGCTTIAILLLAKILYNLFKRKKPASANIEVADIELHEKDSVDSLDVESSSSEELCNICYDNAKEILLLPCGHLCMCDNCSKRIESNCPMCSSAIESRVWAFLN